jgi:catechol 2,3-dioxygenase-like lactoylglutathione lyase family enzyme
VARGLDHIVHAVRDLDAVAHLYRRLGFTVGARNKHSWGTHNHIVQMPGVFVELLTLAEPEKLGDDGFSKLFGAYNGEFLKRAEGLSLLILESNDAAADQRAFAAAGIAGSDVLRFEREGKRPDGSAVKVAFSLAFADDKLAPWVHFCICQQHYPENFWNPDFQHHANSARGVAGVVFVADEPGLHTKFLSDFAGQPDVKMSRDSVTLVTPRGTIDVLTPAAFRQAYETEPLETADGARFSAVVFNVADIAAAEDALAAGEIDAAIGADRVIVDPELAMGATIVFQEA